MGQKEFQCAISARKSILILPFSLWYMAWPQNNPCTFIFSRRLLNETKGSLLDDEQLVNTLQTSKVTSQEVSEQLSVSEVTEVKIDAAREVGIF